MAGGELRATLLGLTRSLQWTSRAYALRVYMQWPSPAPQMLLAMSSGLMCNTAGRAARAGRPGQPPPASQWTLRLIAH